MDPRLLRYYNQELQHLRETGAEFATQFPKIARRLGMEALEVTDPYVERLLEGAAFMAARVQLKLDAEFPRFTQRMIELVYPNYLAPTPAMMISQLQPLLTETNLADGFTVPRGSLMRSVAQQRDMAACEFTTAQDVTLWPLQIQQVKYFTFAPELPLSSLPYASKIKGGLRIKLNTTAGLKFSELKLDTLRLFFAGSDEVAFKLHQLCCGSILGGVVLPGNLSWHERIKPAQCLPVGYSDDQALLPATGRGMLGYRLLQEYFAFPQRFLFLDINGLQQAVRKNSSNEMELVLLFERGDVSLERVVDVNHLALFCTPTINLFDKRADRIHLNEKDHEYHIVPDRTRPLDYEVFSVNSVTGYGTGLDSECEFLPFYASRLGNTQSDRAYFTIQREMRFPSDKQLRNGFRSSYIGSEVFVSLVDANEAPLRSDLKQLSLSIRCTNRDLPIILSLGLGKSDFILDDAAPLDAIRCIKGPSKPYSPLANGDNAAWKLINQLSLNYLSLVNQDAHQGASALREMLELYVTSTDVAMLRQIQGLRSVNCKPVTKRIQGVGPICFGRGLEIDVEIDDLAFQGGSAFLFGSVLSEFFARHVSLNSFTETILHSAGQGKIMHWDKQWGKRAIL